MRRERAFSACYSLTSVEIPFGVTAIGNSAFESCDSLTSITWDGNVYTSYSDFKKAFDKAHPSDN